MVKVTLQQMVDERISFLKEQINPENNPEVNSAFQLQIDAVRSVDDHDIKKSRVYHQLKEVSNKE